MHTTSADKGIAGLCKTTWLIIFCFFNLFVTLALFVVVMKKSYVIDRSNHMKTYKTSRMMPGVGKGNTFQGIPMPTK